MKPIKEHIKMNTIRGTHDTLEQLIDLIVIDNIYSCITTSLILGPVGNLETRIYEELK